MRWSAVYGHARVEVSESTVSRWMRGHAVPDENTLRRLRWLHRQTWYLRSSDFVLAMWSPGAGADAEAVQAALAKSRESAEGRYFSEVAYSPTGSPHIVKCRLTLAMRFQSFTLYVLGARRHAVERSHTEREATGQRTLRFDTRLRPAPRQAKPTLERGSSVEFYLHYLV